MHSKNNIFKLIFILRNKANNTCGTQKLKYYFPANMKCHLKNKNVKIRHNFHM